ncbi:neutral and basic amino acid transport protein rBAT-like [Lingula anatina]|uniref:Neutral and basic amino acid transport protein rBAT-like n=1 Tax=Lingula anatina TaxID=7574 RepID=A0A1S3KC55_LINAN|nr:neutral and basic amino acid transport protein rBAT-like [Lingula anatina]|eukprot:XP_013420072.1 neutral and basic amino acid transport protein rBAT-like [Lingula anatina]
MYLAGIESRLDYIKDLGVGALWMGSVYKSPIKDFGYDVSDFKDIDPVFGTLDDMKNLIAKMKEIGLHLILDFIPNHTSDQHPWFNNSRQATDPSDRYYSYYVWRDCGNDTYRDYPTNWVSVFGNSSWTYDSVRKQCYLHQYLKEQPDLNLMNPYVQEELENILQYWMDLGVDGFRVSATSHLFEDYLWRNEPIIDSTKSQVDYQNFYHNFTISQPATFDILARWRALLDHQTEKDGVYKLLMADVTDASEEDQMKYYGLYGRDGADMPHNFGLLQKLNRNCGGTCVKEVVDDWLSNMPPGRWPNFLVGNHDYPRILTKMDVQFVNAINMLLLLLPGTPTTYYGEEIGMNDIAQPTPPQDPWGRDPERSPMQWSNASLASFSNCTGNYDPQKCPWLPVNQDYLAGVNVQAQEQDKDSSLNLYKSLAKLRQEPTFLHGKMKYAIVDDDIFSYVKDWPGETK